MGRLEKKAHELATKLYEAAGTGGAPGGGGGDGGAGPGGNGARPAEGEAKKKGDVIDAEFEETS
jgi:hypothetical protein